MSQKRLIWCRWSQTRYVLIANKEFVYFFFPTLNVLYSLNLQVLEEHQLIVGVVVVVDPGN